MTFDLTQFAGVAGLPLIIAAVQWIKANWPEAPSYYWPLATIGIAVVLNVGIAAILHTDLGVAVGVGLGTAFMASGVYTHARTTSDALAPPTPAARLDLIPPPGPPTATGA